MSHLAGKGGSVAIATTVAGIKSWTLDYVKPELDTSDFGDEGVYTCIPGGPSRGSGTFEGYKDGIPKTLTSSDPIQLGLNESATATWSGDALVTGIHAATSFDGLVTYSYDFTFTGAITAPTV